MNIAEERYNEAVILSFPGGESGSAAFLVELLDTILRDDAPNGTIQPIVHLPATFFAADGATERRPFVRGIVSKIIDGTVLLWSGGYAGSAVDLLHPDEAETERAWGERNRWKNGLEDILGSAGRRYFPFRMRSDQIDDLIPRSDSLCIGYETPPQPNTTADLIMYDSGGRGATGWYRVRSHVLDATAFIDGAKNGDDWPVPSERNAIHVVFPPRFVDHLNPESVGIAIRELVARYPSAPPSPTTITTGAPERETDTNRPTVVGTLFSGVAPYRLEAEPAVLALIARERERSVMEDTSVRRLILSAAGQRTAGRRVVTESYDEIPPAPQPEEDGRELQGGISGAFTMQEGPLRARFLGGRLAGFALGQNDGPEPPRAQGFLKRKNGAVHPIDYLETAFAAWFSGSTERGITEHATLHGGITIETWAIMIERFPGLLFRQEITVPPQPPSDSERLVPYELALLPLPDDRSKALRYRIDGSPRDTDAALIGNDEEEHLVSARHCTVDLPTGSVRISVAAAQPRLIAPIRFVVVPRRQKRWLAIRTVPELATASPQHWPIVRSWSVAYIVSPATVPPEEIALTAKIAARIHAFTAEPRDASSRNTP